MKVRPGAQPLRIGLGIVVTSCAAVACAPAPDRARHDVPHYREHAEDRAARLQQCAADPGSLATHQDCITARKAERLEGVGSLQSLPPMALPLPPPATPPK
ncbi:MAG: EexN family lipoprotein [Chloroflexota bacterium]|nr:EexN family lipoprotein [Chloroflexota bacterium]